MCGRYTLRRFDFASRAEFEAARAPSFEEFSERARFNVAPSQGVPVIRLDRDGGRVIDVVRWGLIPSWVKGKPAQQPINARAETVATSGMFRQAFERRRCLVPADGFFEWQRLDDTPKPAKQPMYIHRRDDGVFVFAGLWERWRPAEDAPPVDTCTIITTRPNGLMSPIHDRMPVILSPADYAQWLDRDTPGTAVAHLLKPYTGDEFVAEPVSNRVNSPRNDDETCVAPLAT